MSDKPNVTAAPFGDKMNAKQTLLRLLEDADDFEQVVVVDLSRADFNVPVVRVIIPGLEGAYGHEQGDCVPGRRARAVIPFGQ